VHGADPADTPPLSC